MNTEAKHELREQQSSRELSGLRLHQFPSAWNDDANLLAVNRPGNSPLGRNWISVITNEAGENICETHGATADEAVEIAQAFLRAVNNHDALIEALEFALRESGCDGDLCNYRWHEKARAALAAAQE